LQNEESRPDESPPAPPGPTSPEPPTKRRDVAATRDADLVRALDRLPRSAQRIQFLREEIARVEQKQQTLLREVHAKYDPEFDPDQPVPPIDFEAVRRLLPADVASAIVQYTLTQERGLALVITRDDIQAVTLPDLNDRQAIDLALAWYKAYYARHDGPAPGLHRWGEAIPALLEPVARRAVWPVVERLAGRGIGRLILCPNRALHLFPLHACRLSNGPYLAERFEVTYTPSLSILSRCAGRDRPRRDCLLLVENPTGDLPFTEVEGAELRRRYPEPNHTWLYGSQASKQRLLQEAGGCEVLNYTGHAFFDLEEPLRSALILGDARDREQWLTLRDIFCGLHLQRNRLTVINGCETGMLRPDRADEFVGLPSGFLYAGARCVLSTLWSVSDLSSALLVSRFHQEWLGGRSEGAALREAQRWLREDIPTGPYLQREILPGLLQGLDEAMLRKRCEEQAAYYAREYPDRPPFAGPVHWAAFIATGLAFPLASLD
jgi:CHAT domain-containing protein